MNFINLLLLKYIKRWNNYTVQLSEKRVYLNFRDGEEFILRNNGAMKMKVLQGIIKPTFL